MNKQFKIIQIDSFMGIFLIFLALMTLLVGIGIFPMWLIMNLWNTFIPAICKLPSINWYQAGLLWVAILLAFYLLLKNHISVNINIKDGESLTKEELNELFIQKLSDKDEDVEEKKDEN